MVADGSVSLLFFPKETEGAVKLPNHRSQQGDGRLYCHNKAELHGGIRGKALVLSGNCRYPAGVG